LLHANDSRRPQQLSTNFGSDEMPDSIIRNEYGEVVSLKQPSAAVSDRSTLMAPHPRTVQQVADQFLHSNLPQLNLGELPGQTGDATRDIGTGSPVPLVAFAGEKDIAGAKVAIYKQTALGLDVFDAQVGVQIDSRTMNVGSLQSSAQAEITIVNPQALRRGRGERVGKKKIEEHLGFSLAGLSHGIRPRQVIYRYEPDRREDQHLHENAGCLHPGGAAIPHLPPLTIEGLEKGQHFICDEILFRAVHVEGEAPVNWRMLVEPESGDVLYLRALVACVTGLVFDKDPQTQGGANVTGASSNAELNPFRSSVTLPGLVLSTPQGLKGEFVEIVDISAPAISPPLVPGPSNAFNYDVRTDNFSAVNAYYNCDRLFRTMQTYGFDVAGYFDGTTFPVRVDHRGKGGQLNADAPGTPAGTGLCMMRFGLILPPNEVGIATSNRVVWHEFGHALLWDHVSSPNFGFAHSAGDALAAILNDPGSLEADRFDTFPWVQQGASLGRRHDRAIEDGWAWFGPNYDEQYNGEQILSTTLFRFYRAIGGDAEELATQVRASDASAFLIFKAIGLLTSTTPYPEVFVQALQTADLTTPDFRGVPGGALHKVVRWAFEKQGLFQEGAAPGKGNIVTGEGNPPEVDIYIDDGRAGEYQYQANHWSCRDMWVRRTPDGGTKHQHPIPGQTNYMYVRVGNRGTQIAQEVTVAANHGASGTGLSFPDDCTPMEPPALPSSAAIAPGESAIVGPFAFTPGQTGSECLLAIASSASDPANDSTLTGTIAEHRFVPFDNNIGLRNVHPVLPKPKWLVSWFRDRELVIRNPFREVKQAEISLKLPVFMRERGWEVLVKSAGGKRFEMAAHERRRVVLGIREGSDLEPEAVQQAIDSGDGEIVLTTTLDGELSGGVSYPLSFEADGDDPAGPGENSGGQLVLERPAPEEVLRAIEGRQLRRVVIDFEQGSEAAG
jgi:hypothetical protein